MMGNLKIDLSNVDTNHHPNYYRINKNNTVNVQLADSTLIKDNNSVIIIVAGG